MAIMLDLKFFEPISDFLYEPSCKKALGFENILTKGLNLSLLDLRSGQNGALSHKGIIRVALAF